MNHETNQLRPHQTSVKRAFAPSVVAVGRSLCGRFGSPLLLPEAAIANTGAPQRLVVVFTPNGTVPESFWPVTLGSESEFMLNSIMQPLAAYQNRLLVLKGLNIEVAKTGPGGPHQKVSAAC